MLKQQSDYYEHYYHRLTPWVHYVPVKRDLSDLIEKVEWAKANDEMAKTIAKNGANFARNNLLPQHIFCYHVSLFLVSGFVLSVRRLIWVFGKKSIEKKMMGFKFSAKRMLHTIHTSESAFPLKN